MLAYLILRGLAEGLFGIALPAEPGFLIRPASGALITLVIALALLGRGRELPGLRWLQIRNERLRPPAIFAGQGLVLGAVIGLAYLVGFGAFDWGRYFGDSPFNPYGLEIALYSGLIGFFAWRVTDRERLQESVYLTARTSAMVCWLFVGSWTFASVFSYLGGHELIKEFVVGLELSPILFLILAQLIIFLLGWPWSGARSSSSSFRSFSPCSRSSASTRCFSVSWCR